jgi:hypothetical protein
MAYDRAAYTQGATFAPKQILADGDYTTRKVTILTGASLVAGSLIGAVLAAASATVTPGAAVSGSGGTVGNGAVGTWTSDAGAMAGTWQLRFTLAATNAGKYEVVRPDGTVDGIGTVGVAYNGQINGTLADGSADWVADDYVPIVVSYASGLKYKLSASASTDGSQTPDFILAQDADASSGDVEAIVYETGQFNWSGLTAGAGITLAAIREGLRLKGILIDD